MVPFKTGFPIKRFDTNRLEKLSCLLINLTHSKKQVLFILIGVVPFMGTSKCCNQKSSIYPTYPTPFENYLIKSGAISPPQPKNGPHPNQLINQSTNQPTNQSSNQSTHQPTNQPTHQPINQFNQPINQPTNQPKQTA